MGITVVGAAGAHAAYAGEIRMKQWMDILRQLSMLTQFALLLVTPLLLCLAVCYLLTAKLHVGGWVYIPGFFFGLGGSGTVGWNFYKSVTKHEGRRADKKKKPQSWNEHI